MARTRRVVGVVLLAAAAGLSAPARAETALINVHVQPFAGSRVDRWAFISGAAVKVDTTAITPLGPLSPQLELFGAGGSTTTVLDQGALFGAGVGMRLRLWNDEQGFRFNPGTRRVGTWWGNAWADAHLTLSSGQAPVGFDVAVGAELSVVEGLSLGPFVRFHLAQGAGLLMAGLSLAIGAPQTMPRRADYDRDGVLGPADGCPDQAEDADGFEDGDGCPDPDDDGDGVADDADRCGGEAEDVDGVADEDGCPEVDVDGDEVPDEADRCPLEPGVSAGCPDTDGDGDGVVDRLDLCLVQPGGGTPTGCPDRDGDGIFDAMDRCPEGAGPPWNRGCPAGDADRDGVPDAMDACVAVKGAVGGCPAAAPVQPGVREWTVAGGVQALLDALPAPLLDQLAAMIRAHPEVAELVVTGPEPAATRLVDALVGRGVDRARVKVRASDSTPALVPVLVLPPAP